MQLNFISTFSTKLHYSQQSYVRKREHKHHGILKRLTPSLPPKILESTPPSSSEPFKTIRALTKLFPSAVSLKKEPQDDGTFKHRYGHRVQTVPQKET